MSDKMTILPKSYAKAGMSVYDMQQNGNALQKRYAHIFDSDGNGVFDAKEAKLFNASSLKQENNGDLTIWTNFTSGKKKTVMDASLLKNDIRLQLNKEGKKEYIRRIDAPDKGYGSLEIETDGKYELTIGESCDPNGHYVVSGNVTKYYDEKNRLTGSIERKDGKEYYKDNKGNVLYSLHRIDTGTNVDDLQYYDSKNRLRYEIEQTDFYKNKVNIYEYSEKGELVNRFNDIYGYCEPYYDPHEQFTPLKKLIESNYMIPEE